MKGSSVMFVMMRVICQEESTINLVKMEALAELVLGQFFFALCPRGVGLVLYSDYNLNTELSHLVLFNAALK